MNYPHWAIIRRGWNYAGGFKIMKVTSETDRMIYGSEDGIGTKCKPNDIKARFGTEQEAKNKIEVISHMWKNFEPELKELELKSKALWSAREKAIKELI